MKGKRRLRQCPRCRRFLKRRQKACSEAHRKAARRAAKRDSRIVAGSGTAGGLLPGRRELAARLAAERRLDLETFLADAAWLGIQLYDGRKPEVPRPAGAPEGASPEYAALLALHEARGTPPYRRMVERFAASQDGLARAYAKRWAGGSVDRDELEQAARLGLLEAIAHWTPKAARGGWQKHTFLWMRHAVQQLVHRHGLVREPVQVRLDRKAIERAQRQDPDLDDQQLAARTGLSLKRVRQARQAAPRAVFGDDEDT